MVFQIYLNNCFLATNVSDNFNFFSKYLIVKILLNKTFDKLNFANILIKTLTLLIAI